MILIDCSIFSIKLQINTRHYLLYESNCGIFSKPFMRNFSLKKTCCLATNIQLLYSQHCDRCWPSTIMSRWRHQMETFSALLALCEGNPPATGGFPSQRSVTRSFDVFFDESLNRQLNIQWNCRWFETPWSPCDVVPRHVQAILTNFAFLYIYIYIYIYIYSVRAP